GLLEAGARVVMMSNSDKADDYLRKYNNQFGESKVALEKANFYRANELENGVQNVTGRERVDGLVNNAYDLSARTGFNTPEGHLDPSTSEQWRAELDSGIYWAVRATQIIGAQMKTAGGGSIINVSSMYGVVSPNPKLYEGTRFFNPPTYGVMKAGML